MGGCMSRDPTAGAFTNVEQQELLLRFADLRTALHLTEREFMRMYRYFAAANLNDDGCIQLDEFLVFFAQDKSRFTRRAFDMFRDGNEDGITFKQWVFGLWNFCTTDSDALILFAFQLYDRNGAGLLDLQDAKHMLTQLFGKEYETNPLARDVMKNLLETDYQGNPTTSGITAARFARVAARAKNLLYPAFKLQSSIQGRIFGSSFWAEKTRERLRLQREGVLDIRNVLDILNAGRRRMQGHVVRGGVIMPYVSARGGAETSAERAERERMSRLTDIVGGDELSSILAADADGSPTAAKAPPSDRAGSPGSPRPAAAAASVAPRKTSSPSRSLSVDLEPSPQSPLAGATPSAIQARGLTRSRSRVMPVADEPMLSMQAGAARPPKQPGASGAAVHQTSRPSAFTARASSQELPRASGASKASRAAKARARRLTAATRRAAVR